MFSYKKKINKNNEFKDVSDEELISRYEELRDKSVCEGESDNVYPNIRNIYGSALEREKDRREIHIWTTKKDKPLMQDWYETAKDKPCLWWIQNHLVAKNALKSCLRCGVCVSECPAAEYYEEYNPRIIIDAALSNDEDTIVALLKSETLWYCGQCGSCKPKCPNGNNLVGLISSLRMLSQLKGYHLYSLRGRQQYAARHLWGANLWNRACSLYFRNVDPESHPDFGPRFKEYHIKAEEEMKRLGASPDRNGSFGGRKISNETLTELRNCVYWGGSLVLWDTIEELAYNHAKEMKLSIDDYYNIVKSEG